MAAAEAEGVASVAALVAQVPVLAVVEAGLCWLALLVLVTSAALLEQVPVLAQPMAVLRLALAAQDQAEDRAEALVHLLSRPSFSAATAGITT